MNDQIKDLFYTINDSYDKEIELSDLDSEKIKQKIEEIVLKYSFELMTEDSIIQIISEIELLFDMLKIFDKVTNFNTEYLPTTHGYTINTYFQEPQRPIVTRVITTYIESN